MATQALGGTGLSYHLVSSAKARIQSKASAERNQERNDLLGELKSHITSIEDADPLFTEEVRHRGNDTEYPRESSSNSYFPKADQYCNIDRLISILDNAVLNYTEEQLETLATPLITLLRKVFEFAPALVKPHIQTALLPSIAERSQPLGRANTLASRLLRLSNSAVAPSLRESISSLLFELSDKDATSFVRNVGYGFASGFLMTHDLHVPENAMEGYSTGDGGDLGEKVTKVDGKEINPVTGQIKAMEPKDVGEEMTEEEKEREAERLFVLFER
ncbi:MAG: hypothetical protein LQ351_000306 [Letrouitia transgressa]|nr:MAG: hypothetical protein LQ351_000306 [Letrouitia transgressa]